MLLCTRAHKALEYIYKPTSVLRLGDLESGKNTRGMMVTESLSQKQKHTVYNKKIKVITKSFITYQFKEA